MTRSKRLPKLVTFEKKPFEDIGCLSRLVDRIEKAWADGGYRGAGLLQFVEKLWGWIWEVTPRGDKTVNFEVIPKRWVVAAMEWRGHLPGPTTVEG